MVAKRYIIGVYPRGTIESEEIKVELPTKPSATKLSRTKIQYNLRIEPELMDWLKELGQEYERPVNYLINHAVKQMKNENRECESMKSIDNKKAQTFDGQGFDEVAI